MSDAAATPTTIPTTATKPNPKSPGALTILGMVTEALIGALVGGFGTVYIMQQLRDAYGKPGLAEILLLVGSWGLGAIVVVIVHELGHALAGKLVGRSIYLFTIGPFEYRHGTDGRSTFAIRRPRAAMGMVIAIGPPAAHTATRDIIFAAAGPMANLLTAVAIGLALAIFDAGKWPTIFLAPMALVSLLIGLVNLLPTKKSGLIARDGRQIFDRLLGRTTPRDMAVIDILRLIIVGTRPRDWPPEMIERLEGPEDESTASIMAHWYRHEAAVDCGDLSAAGAWADRLLGRIDTLSQDWIDGLAPTFAFYLALHCRDAVAAEALLARMVREISPTETFTIAARSAIALAKGDRATARTLADEAIALYRKEPGLLTPDALDRLEELRRATVEQSVAA